MKSIIEQEKDAISKMYEFQQVYCKQFFENQL